MMQGRIDKTRDKLRHRTLPRATPDDASTRAGSGSHCDGCDDMIEVGQTEYDVVVRGLISLRFHEACYTAWATFRE
jgi:hypothetical protein